MFWLPKQGYHPIESSESCRPEASGLGESIWGLTWGFVVVVMVDVLEAGVVMVRGDIDEKVGRWLGLCSMFPWGCHCP
jgi:hypothetical protein